MPGMTLKKAFALCPPQPTSIVFSAFGTPQPQGNKSGFIGRDGRVHLVEGRRPASRAAFKSWREVVEFAARDAQRKTRAQQYDGYLSVTLVFRMPRPKAAKKRAYPNVAPDVDKLARLVFDSLTCSGLIADDARIVKLNATKIYAETPADVGVTVRLDSIDPTITPTPEDASER